jgi:hypothetical protein
MANGRSPWLSMVEPINLFSVLPHKLPERGNVQNRWISVACTSMYLYVTSYLSILCLDSVSIADSTSYHSVQRAKMYDDFGYES